MWKNTEKRPFSGRLRPDWGNTTRAATAGLGSIGLMFVARTTIYNMAINKRISEGKPTRMRRLCLKTSEAEGRGGLGITSSSEEVYELML